jgi:hypothetical protein
VIETRNMSPEKYLQIVSGNTHEREGGGVSFKARRSKSLISKPDSRRIVGGAYNST